MILFIDDEPRIMDSYRSYLEITLKPDGYNVVFCSDVDKAVAYFESHLGEIDLIILDIMMPPGKSFQNKKTSGGLKTGLFFYDEIRAKAPELPVLIFTNFVDEEEERRFRKDPRCSFLHKSSYLLTEFVSEVRKALSLLPPAES